MELCPYCCPVASPNRMRTSSCTPKPTEKAPKKGSCSISTTSTSTAKKAKSKPVAPPRSPLPLTPPRPLVSTVSPTPPRSAQPNIEDEDEVEEEQEEDDDVEELPPPAPVRFMSVWKAVNGKETLPGTRSAVLTEDTIYLSSIETWRDKVLLDLLPPKFKIQQLNLVKVRGRLVFEE